MEIPRVSTTLTLRDRLGGWGVRWGIRRMRYRVEPGLYALGSPGGESPVLVTASYKLSFDRLRSSLGGRDAWILVLDTRGINVWCAAGKGTFGTEELLRRIEGADLERVVSHRTLVLPQLGAPGVSAHEVRTRSGWRVVYGPVRAADLPGFLERGMRKEPGECMVRFPLAERLAVVPVELVSAGKVLVPAAAGFVAACGLGRGGFSPARAAAEGPRALALAALAALGGAVLTPALLPWIPGRPFALKGALVGVVLAAAASLAGALRGWGGWGGLGWWLMIPALSSFLAMNFTGASTYTSLSGVRREVRAALPVQIAAAGIGLALWIAGRFV